MITLGLIAKEAVDFSPSFHLRVTVLIMRITVEIPDDLARHLVSSGQDAARILLENLAVEAYRERKLTMEQVRQLLGFGTRMQVDSFLQQHQVYDYTVDDLEKDLATQERLTSKSIKS